jgi:hypothetical protein
MVDEQARHDRDEGGGGWDEDRDPTVRRAIARLMHPIPLTVLIILVSVVMLLAANVLGWDDGLVLMRMADHEFARGLITYLFAVTTIGTSVVLVLAALMGSLGDSAYQRGKEILALLLGVFGTMVGFYFGTEAHSNEAAGLAVSQPLLSSTIVAPGGVVHLTAYVSGGRPPYTFTVTLGRDADAPLVQGSPDQIGWISTDVTLPADATTGDVPLVLAVKDNTALTAAQEALLTVRPAQGP